MSEVGSRKDAHLDLCIGHDVEARASTLLDQVHLLHEALPEIRWDEVDTSLELMGRTLEAPILISGMTGGTPRAGAVNRALAAAAQKLGFGMGVGSQRAMLLDPACADSYQVRDVAPDILLLANIGVVQAREAGIEAVAWLATRIGADAVCVHCNVAQELVQDEGDRDFRGCAAFLGQLVRELSVPVVVKETGCGFAPSTLCRLRDAGVRFVDVSGRGGTTWTGVEAMRGSRRQRALGRALCEWGIPTAAAIAWASRLGLHPIASGGIRGVTDLAAALALGACAVGLALPFLRAHDARGVDGVLEVGHELAEGLRAVMVLTGSRRPADLVDRHRVIDGELARWLEAAL